MQMGLAREEDNHDQCAPDRQEVPDRFEDALDDGRPCRFHGVIQRIEEKTRERNAEPEETVHQQVRPPTLVVVRVIRQESPDERNGSDSHEDPGKRPGPAFKLEFHGQLFIGWAGAAAVAVESAGEADGREPPCWRTLMYSITSQRSRCDSCEACDPIKPFP